MLSSLDLMNHFSEAKRNGEELTVLLDLWESCAESFNLKAPNYRLKVTNDGHNLLLLLTKEWNDDIIYSFEVSSDDLRLWSQKNKVKLIRSDNNQGHMHLCDYNKQFVLTIGQDNPLSICPLCKFIFNEDQVVVLKRLALTISNLN